MFTCGTGTLGCATCPGQIENRFIAQAVYG